MSNLSEKEITEILNELKNVRPEQLTGEAKRLFEAIMRIADERDELLEKNKEYEKQLDLDYVEENYIHKDKIKAKIEELQKEKIEMTVDIINHNTLAEIIRDEQINILQLLLEKE